MDKKYCDFLDEISAGDLYEGLLGYGLFANKLPPVFTAEYFCAYCLNNNPIFVPNKAHGEHGYVLYNSMRNTNLPRLFGIPTPMMYQRLCAVLRDNWDALKGFFHNQTDANEYRISRIHLRKMCDTKALFEMNYKDWRVDGNPETDLLISQNEASKFLVHADISTCFPSIYSHAIPWALVGKEEAKRNRDYKDYYYNKIDTACYCMKNGETHGLLIGPHTSNLLSEIILTKIDNALYEKGYRFYRNIDDYSCFVSSNEIAQRFLCDLEEELRAYDLTLNHKKTLIQSLPIAITETWIHKLSAVQLVTGYGKTSYEEINTYLDTAIAIATDTGDSAVLKYAIKKLASLKLTSNAKKYGSKRIMHLAVVYPYLLQLMEKYVFRVFDVDVASIKSFADAVYQEAKNVNNYEAISYCIYYSLKYHFLLQELDQNWVIQHNDCILLLMTWLYYININHGNRKASDLKLLRKEAERLRDLDMDRYWLFCYEAIACSNLPSEWQPLKKAGISFIIDGLVCRE